MRILWSECSYQEPNFELISRWFRQDDPNIRPCCGPYNNLRRGSLQLTNIVIPVICLLICCLDLLKCQSREVGTGGCQFAQIAFWILVEALISGLILYSIYEGIRLWAGINFWGRELTERWCSSARNIWLCCSRVLDGWWAVNSWNIRIYTNGSTNCKWAYNEVSSTECMSFSQCCTLWYSMLPPKVASSFVIVRSHCCQIFIIVLVCDLELLRWRLRGILASIWLE